MDDVNDNELQLEEGLAADHAAGSDSLLERITKKRAQLEDVLTIDIPSWDGDLRAKYKLQDRREIEKMVRRIRARATKETMDQEGINADLDFLIKACVGVVAYDVEEDQEVPLTNGYTMELVDILKPVYPKNHPKEGEPVEINGQRELVAYMLGWNNIALATHGQAVARWMQDTSKKPVGADPQ